MGVRLSTPIFLFTKQTLQTAKSVPNLVYVNLSLDKIHQCFDLIVGKIDTQKAFYRRNRILLKFGSNIFVIFDFMNGYR